MMFSNIHRLYHVVFTLIAGSCGGAFLYIVGLPAAWLSGAAIVSVVLTLQGVKTQLPPLLMNIVFIMLGVSLGSGVTPETLERIAAWPLSAVALIIMVPVLTLIVSIYFMRVAHWDKVTAFMASLPGALSYVLAAAPNTQADVRNVAISQSMRVLALVVLLPSIINVFGTSVISGPASTDTASLYDILLLYSVCSVAGLGCYFLKMPAGLLSGALFASSALYASEIVTKPLPWWLTVPGFIALGCLIGSRFSGANWQQVRHIFTVSIGAFVLSMSIAMLFALSVSHFLSIPIGQTLLAFAPGGLEAMVILAFTLNLDPAYVAAHHLARFLFIGLTVPFFARHFVASQDSKNNPDIS